MPAIAEADLFRKITALGPIKMEVVHTAKAGDDYTFTTLIQNPQFVMLAESTTSAATASATFSGKTVTVKNVVAADGSADVTVLVFGF